MTIGRRHNIIAWFLVFFYFFCVISSVSCINEGFQSVPRLSSCVSGIGVILSNFFFVHIMPFWILNLPRIFNSKDISKPLVCFIMYLRDSLIVPFVNWLLTFIIPRKWRYENGSSFMCLVGTYYDCSWLFYHEKIIGYHPDAPLFIRLAFGILPTKIFGTVFGIFSLIFSCGFVAHFVSLYITPCAAQFNLTADVNFFCSGAYMHLHMEGVRRFFLIVFALLLTRIFFTKNVGLPSLLDPYYAQYSSLITLSPTEVTELINSENMEEKNAGMIPTSRVQMKEKFSPPLAFEKIGQRRIALRRKGF